MRLEYCENGNLNVGDDLNQWLWPQLIPECLDQDQRHVFLGIGTLLTKKRVVKQLSGVSTLAILSSGAWGPQAPRCASNWRVYGVRGPRSADWIGLDSSYVVGDGAYLLRRCISDELIAPQATTVGFVPHHRSEDYIDWSLVCQSSQIKLISPRQPVESFMRDVSGCRLVLSEAMHGAIIADALRVPWAPVKFSPTFSENKWLDWGDSIGQELDFFSLPFVCRKRPSIGKRAENVFRKMTSISRRKRDKINKGAELAKLSSEEDVEVLGEAIRYLSESVEGQLSTDSALSLIDAKLDSSVEAFRADWCSR